MHAWGRNYRYRLPLGAFLFIMTTVGSITIVWITPGYGAIKSWNG
ncbi:MAG: hypothetical protein ACRDE5_06725 [Ginsengibacter sp.]